MDLSIKNYFEIREMYQRTPIFRWPELSEYDNKKRGVVYDYNSVQIFFDKIFQKLTRVLNIFETIDILSDKFGPEHQIIKDCENSVVKYQGEDMLVMTEETFHYVVFPRLYDLALNIQGMITVNTIMDRVPELRNLYLY